ncbi:MAG TPA: hypothetical protein QF753_10100 [Victivallales bacterium]|nr:hypothetical protein [Victivallales bacterium]
MNNLKDNSKSQKKTAKTEEAQSSTEIKYKKSESIGIDLNAFKERLLAGLDKESAQYEILNNISSYVLWNADYSLIDRLKTKGDVSYCSNCLELYIQNQKGCYHCEKECRYC